MRIFNKIFLVMSLLSFSAAGLAGGDETKSTSTKKKSSRSLASVSTMKLTMGQGEQMLYNVKDTRPAFMNPQSKTGRVQFAGVCRDAYGMTYYAHEKGYASCIDAQSIDATNGSVNGYFGPAQRQAGVGILVGQ